jgi:hypothetical protein
MAFECACISGLEGLRSVYRHTGTFLAPLPFVSTDIIENIKLMGSRPHVTRHYKSDSSAIQFRIGLYAQRRHKP